jgi:anti-sigma B factor antagonist
VPERGSTALPFIARNDSFAATSRNVVRLGKAANRGQIKSWQPPRRLRNPSSLAKRLSPQRFVSSTSTWHLGIASTAKPLINKEDRAYARHLPRLGNVTCFHERGNVFSHSTITSIESLQITVAHDDESTTVRLKGHLGIDTSPELRNRLLALLEEQTPKVVIVDLNEASYFDTSGIATLLEAFKIARNRQRKLCLNGIQGRVARFFEVTGLSDVFETTVCKTSPRSEVN